MLTMIGKRLMFAIPSLIGVVIVTFLLTRALPGDPAAYFAGPAATTEAIQQIRAKLAVGQPRCTQYIRCVVHPPPGHPGRTPPPGKPASCEQKPLRPLAAEPSQLGLQ